MHFGRIILLFALMPLVAMLVLEVALYRDRDRYGPLDRPLLVIDEDLGASLLTRSGEVQAPAPDRPVSLEGIPSALPRALLIQEDQAF